MKTILLDGDVWLHRACAVATTSVTFGDESTLTMNQAHAEAWFREELSRLRKRLGVKPVIIALGDRKANFRKELDPGYKSHRAPIKPPGFLEFEARIVKRCKTVSEPRLEGDDILGLLATKMKDTVIVSVDKDLQQIPGLLYNPDRDTLEQITPDYADWIHMMQTLTGDRVDGYPGCPGIGFIRAQRLLPAAGANRWLEVVKAYEKAGELAEQALLQARLAFILRQGYYNRETKEVRLWTPG